MATRVTGMYSGLDTESLISELVSAKSKSVDKIKKNKTKAEWTSEKWSDLNKKIKSLKSTITGLQFSTDYYKKTTKVSNSNAVSVITGSGAMNSVQSLSIKQLAKSGYLTGAKIESQDKSEVTSSTTMGEIVGSFAGEGSFSITTGGKTTQITFDETTTVSSVISKLKSAGVSANFDSKNQRIFIGASASGTENDFAITADDSTGLNIMNGLGINAGLKADTDVNGNPINDATRDRYKELVALKGAVSTAYDAGTDTVTLTAGSDLYKYLQNQGVDMEDTEAVKSEVKKLQSQIAMAESALAPGASGSSSAIRISGEDAIIELNGATFTGSSNSIEVNGLTFTCTAVADDITVTTEDDTDGIYDMLKSFIKQYNELVVEMDKAYNAESASDYEPLTEDEKSAMSDKEVETWENKIKESLLRRDSDLGTVFNTLKDVMASGFTVGGKTLYLSSFGISAESYFEAADHEKSVLHIDGDPDDEKTSGNEDVLKSMIATDSASVISFFTQLANSLSDKLSSLSTSTNDRSYGNYYDDKKMKSDLSDWETKISEAEEKLAAYEDKWYDKFSKMETALSKLDSKNSYISSLFSN